MGGPDGWSACRKHPGRKAGNAKSVVHLLIFFVPFALGYDGLPRAVIYPPSEEHEHLRPGFRNHRHSLFG